MGTRSELLLPQPRDARERRRPRVCLVTPGPISCNPRIVKEADALGAAGCDVRVVSSQHAAWLVPWDRELAAGRPWSHEPLYWGDTDGWPRALRYYSGARQLLCRTLARAGVFHAPVAELAGSRLYREQLAAVLRVPSDLIIAHYPPALPVACRAAARLGVPVAFDAEDDHVGEFPYGQENCYGARLVRHLEATYLPRCRYVTAASEGIADALAARYGIARPTPIHNVFPWADRETLDGQVRDRNGPGLSVCWYSQTIGLDRGLQDAIRAAGLVRGPLELHFRGKCLPEVRSALMDLAQQCGVAGRVHLHAPVPPQELLSRVAEHDVGLALEQPVSPNRMATATNKIFFYLLAGLAVVASDTPGQRAIMDSCPQSGFVYAPRDHQALARHLQQLVDSPALLQDTRQAALEVARERWNWETESETLIGLVKEALGVCSR